MKLAYDFYKSFFVINKKLTKETFLTLAGANSGYSKNMFTRMYDSIFSELIDIIEEYDEFYSFEYKNLESYLYKKYNVDPEDIDELSELLSSNSDLKLYRSGDHSYGDYQIPEYAFSETMYERVTNILLLND